MTSTGGGPLPFVPLIEGEIEVEDGDELYLRQCNPLFVKGGQPSDQLFKPSSSDADKLSGSRSSKATAKAAYEFRDGQKKGATAGTWCLSVEEARSVGSRVIDDAESSEAPPAPIPPGHVYLDLRPFSALNKEERRALRSSLLLASLKWGRQHPI